MEEINMKNIMKRAWEIRRNVSKEMNVRVSEISMSDCLKMAWEEISLAKELVKRYNIYVKLINGEKVIASQMVKALKSNKSDFELVKSIKDVIINVIESQDRAKENLAKKKKLQENAIEGLQELRNAISDNDRYFYQNQKYIANGLIGEAPTEPSQDVNELRSRFPRANAYLLADSWSYSRNYKKMALGKQAKEKIRNGRNYNNVIKWMETEWSDYCNQNID